MKRRVFGAAGVLGAAALGVALVAATHRFATRACLVPAVGGLVSLEQARRKFCAGFAVLGLRSVRGSDANERVADAADLAVDRAAARRLVAYCGAPPPAITAAFVVLPVRRRYDRRQRS